MAEPTEEKNITVSEKQDALILNASDSEQGLSTISRNTVARIVTKAVLGVEGVARFAPKGAGDIFSNLFSNKAYDSSLAMEFQEKSVTLNLALNLYFGVAIPEVVAQVRKQVIEQLTRSLSVKVDKVNILVKDLVEPDEKKDEKESAATPDEK